MEYTIQEFSSKLASKEPTPSGGGTCALVSSLASSLSLMVINLTVGKKKYQEYEDELLALKEELEKLRIKLLDAIKKDEEAFIPLANSYKLDKNIKENLLIIEDALKLAASSPLEIFNDILRIIEINERLAVIGSKLAISDIGTAISFAKAVLEAAYLNVLVNTNLMKDENYKNQIEKELKIKLKEYSLRCQNCYQKVIERILNG